MALSKGTWAQAHPWGWTRVALASLLSGIPCQVPQAAFPSWTYQEKPFKTSNSHAETNSNQEKATLSP